MYRGKLIPGLLMVGLLAASPARAASITFSSTQQGTELTLLILGSGFTEQEDLFSFGFDLAFDPNILEATGIFEGDFLPKAVSVPDGGTFFIPGEIVPGLGMITLTLSSLFGADQLGAIGKGVLASVVFQARAGGDTDFKLSNVFLFDSEGPPGNPIPAEFTDGTVTVEGPTPVPEPSTLGLMGIGLAALARRIRRKTPVAR